MFYDQPKFGHQPSSLIKLAVCSNLNKALWNMFCILTECCIENDKINQNKLVTNIIQLLLCLGQYYDLST